MNQYIVSGMSCAACQARVEKAVSKVEGVDSVSVSLLTNSMGVSGSAASADIIEAVRAAGYDASPKNKEAAEQAGTYAAEEEALKDKETPKLVRRLVLSMTFLLALMYITMGHNMWGWPLPAYFEHNHLGLALTQLLLAAAVMIINHKFFTSGFSSLFHGASNMDSLVALGSSVSFAWSVYVIYEMCGMINAGASSMDLMELYHDQLYFESAAMIPALITVGKLLEALSKGKTTDALKSLLRLAPKTAVIRRDGSEIEVPVEEVLVGDTFLVKPGESIPVDGEVIKGNSAVNEAALTGESIPVDKGEGDKVSAGTINSEGFLECRATRVGKDTTLSQVIQLVSDAAATKAPIARIADRVSAVFVPAVITLAVIVIAGWLAAGQSISFALARGISVLVISCPCALGLATPVAVMVGSGKGAKAGILFKTGEALESAGKIQIIALDKTGTITSGEPAVTDIIPAEGVEEKELLKKAAAIEKHSEHPLAKAVVTGAAARGIEEAEAEECTAVPGKGLAAKLEGHSMHGGNESYISGLTKIPDVISEQTKKLAQQGKTPLYFEEDKKLLGIIAVADTIRDDSTKAIAQLKNMGIRVVMLTGDNAITAKSIAKQAGVDETLSSLLPDKKAAAINELKRKGRVAMVGDGINDAPALMSADVGIAIGAGTDVAIDSADVVLMNSSLMDVAAAVRLSRATLRNIHENLFWAFFYNLICIPLAAGLFGLKLNPMIAAAAMSLSSFTVCMNALRLNLFKPYDAAHDRVIGKLDMAELDLPVDKTHEGSIEMNATVKIEGMMCRHCEATVKKALEALDFVESAEVSHEAGTAKLSLSGELNEQAVKEAVEAKDYKYIGLEA